MDDQVDAVSEAERSAGPGEIEPPDADLPADPGKNQEPGGGYRCSRLRARCSSRRSRLPPPGAPTAPLETGSR